MIYERGLIKAIIKPFKSNKRREELLIINQARKGHSKQKFSWQHNGFYAL